MRAVLSGWRRSWAVRWLALALAVSTLVGGCGGGGGSSPSTGGLGAPAVGAAALPPQFNPAAAPVVPAGLPPVVGVARIAAEVGPVAGRTLTWQFQPGWTMFSFPFSALTQVSGFTHQLYAYQGASYVSVDPVAAPASIDTSRAYWAYFPAAASVTVVGVENTGEVGGTSLQPGWNMVGCPSLTSLPVRDMTVTLSGGSPRLVEESVGASLLPGDMLLYRFAYLPSASGGGLFSSLDLTDPLGALVPASGHWIFAWQQAELDLNPVAPATRPQVTGLSSSSWQAGQPVVLSGQGFGEAGAGQVVVAGAALPASAVQSWTSTSIEILVPAGLAGGNLAVLASGFPSNRVAVTVSGGGGGGSGDAGVLSGRVESAAGEALSGAYVVLGSGQFAVTDTSGRFRIEGVPAGTHDLLCTRIGFQPAQGSVTAIAGQERTVLISLTSLGGGSGGGGQTGTLRAVAHTYEPSSTRYWVRRVEVQEYGNYSARWSDSWDSDLGDTSRSLTCSGAVVGRSYVVRVTWRTSEGGEVTNSWYRTLESTDQTFHFYSPF